MSLDGSGIILQESTIVAVLFLFPPQSQMYLNDDDDSATVVIFTRDVDCMSEYAATDVFRKPQLCTATTPFAGHSAKVLYFTEFRETD
jgi:hypothetical protein